MALNDLFGGLMGSSTAALGSGTVGLTNAAVSAAEQQRQAMHASNSFGIRGASSYPYGTRLTERQLMNNAALVRLVAEDVQRGWARRHLELGGVMYDGPAWDKIEAALVKYAHAKEQDAPTPVKLNSLNPVLLLIREA